MELAYKNSDELCRQMAERNDGICLLRFSCGKDAIASYIQLRRFFKEIIPVFHYMHPDLGFINKSLEYYEGIMGRHIFRVPNRMLYKHLNSGAFQTKASWAHINKMKLPNFDNDEVNDYIKDDLGLDRSVMTAIGVRAADSLNRWRTVNKYGAVNEKKRTFYPVYDWDIKRLVSEIKESGIKLPIDYKLWGKSFDGQDYRFIKPLKDHFPEDYEKLKQLFPLLDVELKRYNGI